MPSHIISHSLSTSAVKAKKKAALQDLQLLTRFVTEQAVAPSRPSSLVRTKSSTLLVSTSNKDRGRDKEVKSCPIDFATISGKDKEIENKSPVKDRASSASNKPKSKEKDNEAKGVPRDKPSIKDFLSIKDKMKEKEAEIGMKAEGFSEEKATKEKDKEKEKEKERRVPRQDTAVTEERRTPDLMRPRSCAPKLKHKSQSLIITSCDISASPDSKV